MSYICCCNCVDSNEFWRNEEVRTWQKTYIQFYEFLFPNTYKMFENCKCHKICLQKWIEIYCYSSRHLTENKRVCPEKWKVFKNRSFKSEITSLADRTNIQVRFSFRLCFKREVLTFVKYLPILNMNSYSVENSIVCRFFWAPQSEAL